MASKRIKLIYIYLCSILIAIILSTTITSNSSTVSAARSNHWLRTNNSPAVITVYDEMHDAAWTRTLHASVSEWNAGVDNIELIFGSGAADCINGHGQNTVVVCIHKADQSDWRGQAILHHNNEHILYALVWIDTRDHPPSTRPSLMCHELGHVLGLEHRPEGKTCMTPTAGSNHPDRQDYQTVTVAHNHTH